MFNDEELAVCRSRLLQLQQDLQALKATGEEAAGVVALDQSSVGRLSRMDALQGQAMSQERVRLRDVELRKIAGALRRLETGDYGYCVSCGEPVARKRLEFDPAAALCIACANKEEQG